MNKKLISIAAALIIFTSVLSGCTVADSKQKERFKEITTSGDIIVVYDTQTKVEYAYVHRFGIESFSSLTVLVDADGKPILYKGE